MHASIALCLVTAQILSGGFVAVQPMVCKRHSFWTNKCVSLQVVSKAVLFRGIGELDCRNISSNPQQFQAAVNRAGLIAAVQSNVSHGNTKLYLLLQMAQNLNTLLLICAIHINSGHNTVFAIHS